MDDDVISFSVCLLFFGLLFYCAILMCSYLDISWFAWNIPGWKQRALSVRMLFAVLLSR